MNNISKLIISKIDTLKDALIKIKKNGEGVCFVCEDKKLIGILTQGDIRNLILKKIPLENKVLKYINKKYYSLPATIESSKAFKNLKSGRRIIPLLDKNKKLVDYVSFSKLKNIPLVKPDLNGNELTYLTQCIQSTYISSLGNFINSFEKQFKDYFKVNSALSVSSCTTGLQLVLQSLKLKKNDEVIVPNVTFVSPINAIIHAGGTPILCDINSKNLTLDCSDLEKKITKKTKAIICVHTYGHPCNMRDISNLIKNRNIFLIEDCAEAIGTKFKNKNIGTFGDSAVFSFYGNKTITTGEGGMILFKNRKDFEKCKILRNHGMNIKKKYWHDQVGFNFRMTNLQAAVGVAQFERIEIFIKKKIEIAREYKKNLKEFKNIILPFEEKWATHSYWLFNILIKDTKKNKRDRIIKQLNNQGIEARPMFYPASNMKIYKKYANNKQNYSQLSYSGISLPSFVGLENSQIKMVSDLIKKLIK
jgi:perosamine synthetase